MRVAVVGAGPGGLFLATLLRRAVPHVEVTVFERHRAEDTFGFGVVFSDRAVERIHEADPPLRAALRDHGRHWDEIEVRLKGERIRCGGNGMTAIVRHTLLALMQQRAADVGATLRFRAEVGLRDVGDHDLVVAADGASSSVRDELVRTRGLDLGVELDTARAKFIWFGTDYLFDGLTFVHERGDHGVFAVHGYPISDSLSTFIVETDEASWRTAGLDGFDVGQPPGPSDERSRRYLETLFADQIDGGRLVANHSRWGNFRTRRTARWHTLGLVDGTPPVALLGDAVHTAHFSVGSGTTMAMEDAVALAAALTEHSSDLAAALTAYEGAAQPPVRRIQDSARPSLAWWEHVGRYHDEFEPWQFGYHFLSRSITDARLARRDVEFVDASHRAWARRHGAGPLDTPFHGRGWSTTRRLLPVATDADGSPVDVDGGLALGEQPGSEPWGAVVTAPDTEDDLPVACVRLAELARLDPAPTVVAVHGGTALTRTLTCEQARLHERLPTILVDPPGQDAVAARDRAVTAVLSGRTDLVGVPRGQLGSSTRSS